MAKRKGYPPFRWLWRLLAVVLALPVAFLVGTILLPLVPGPGNVLSGPLTRQIGLIQGPIHTDILLPLTPEVRAAFAFAEGAGVPVQHPGAEWLMFGWGSAALYTTAGTYADITFGAVLTAASGDSSVVRLDLTGPLTPMENLTFLQLSETQYQALVAGLLDTFAAKTPLDHPGFTKFDAFFPARGRFHALRTCNAWLGQTFRAAGIPFGLWTPANWSVNLALDWHLPGQTG